MNIFENNTLTLPDEPMKTTVIEILLRKQNEYKNEWEDEWKRVISPQRKQQVPNLEDLDLNLESLIETIKGNVFLVDRLMKYTLVSALLLSGMVDIQQFLNTFREFGELLHPFTYERLPINAILVMQMYLEGKESL